MKTYLLELQDSECEEFFGGIKYFYIWKLHILLVFCPARCKSVDMLPFYLLRLWYNLESDYHNRVHLSKTSKAEIIMEQALSQSLCLDLWVFVSGLDGFVKLLLLCAYKAWETFAFVYISYFHSQDLLLPMYWQHLYLVLIFQCLQPM